MQQLLVLATMAVGAGPAVAEQSGDRHRNRRDGAEGEKFSALPLRVVIGRQHVELALADAQSLAISPGCSSCPSTPALSQQFGVLFRPQQTAQNKFLQIVILLRALG